MRLVKRLFIYDIVFFAIPFTCGVGYLLAFYPGIITNDSVFQWDQVSRFQIDNWHPAYHTILIWLVTRFRDTLAAFALFQIAAFSSVLAYGLRTFKDLGIPTLLLIIVDIFISIIPMNGLMVITIWKDILFSIAVLLLAIYLWKIILSKGAWIANRWNCVWFGLTVANVSLLRHNGFPVAFGTLLVILLLFTRRKWTFLALGIAILYIGIIIGPVYGIFKVNRQYTQSYGVLFLHPIAAHVENGASFSLDEEAYLDKILPLEKGWPYNCHDATVLFYNALNFSPIQDNPLQAAKIFGRLSLANPLVTARHFKCLSSFVWQIPQPKGVYLETVLTSNEYVSSADRWRAYKLYTTQKSRAPELRDFVVGILEDYSQIDPDMVGWRPAIYLYVLSAAVLFHANRKKNALLLLLLAPVYLQSLVIAFSAQLQALRYQYPVYLVSMLFTLPLIYLSVKPSNPNSPTDSHTIVIP